MGTRQDTPEESLGTLAEVQRQLYALEARRSRLILRAVDSRVEQECPEGEAPEASAEARQRHAVVHNAAVMEVASALNLSEGMVHRIYDEARTARSILPECWRAFRAGRIGAYAVGRICRAAEQLRQPEHRDHLDVLASEYAASHRPAQLNAWLRRTAARMEPEAHRERSARTVADRQVWVRHGEDGVSLLCLVLPTLTAESIARRLQEAARSPQRPVPHDPSVLALHQAAGTHVEAGPARGLDQGDPETFRLPEWLSFGPHGSRERRASDDAPRPAAPDPAQLLEPPRRRADGDPRTVRQREADLAAAWLLNGDPAEGEPDLMIRPSAHIGVLISAEALVGITEDPAVLRDRSQAVRAAALRGVVAQELALSRSGAGTRSGPRRGPSTEQLRWHQLHVRPREPDPPPESDSPPAAPDADHLRTRAPDVLSHHYTGRFVPQILRQAISFRDGVCQAPGCTVPAERCDVDHRVPWEERGRTSAGNLWLLCRRHHRLKGHGYLSTLSLHEC
ncbi:HNH endonuclease signature motif containing protein [Nesterenkonia sp.]|uniref:HNH endonuclease signature motif containing protein n=1 Tax=Nesterenkonia sp. TaxID=704201 RepID=UPI00260B7343|nr:HNH endonuclease signature motif containing protein [Nesterenkonia sp.]